MIEAMIQSYKPRHRHPIRATVFSILGAGWLGVVWSIPPESPTQGPFKTPFQWPTFWSVEELNRQPSASPAVVPVAASSIVEPTTRKPVAGNPRLANFKKKLGQLSGDYDTDPLPPEVAPAALVSVSEPGRVFRHWLKADILSHAPFLAKLSHNHLRTGECRISYYASNESEILQPYDKITLNKGQEDGLNVGDIYELYEVGHSGYAYGSSKEIGREIVPNGMAQIVSVKAKTATARLTQCFGTISRETRASPMVADEKRFAVMGYSTVTGDRPLARVVWVPGAGQLPQPFNYVILDAGVEAGFRLGDHVMVLNQRSSKISDVLLGEGLIVHIEPHSATVMIHDVFPGIINPGDFAMAVQTPQQ